MSSGRGALGWIAGVVGVRERVLDATVRSPVGEWAVEHRLPLGAASAIGLGFLTLRSLAKRSRAKRLDLERAFPSEPIELTGELQTDEDDEQEEQQQRRRGRTTRRSRRSRRDAVEQSPDAEGEQEQQGQEDSVGSLSAVTPIPSEGDSDSEELHFAPWSARGERSHEVRSRQGALAGDESSSESGGFCLGCARRRALGTTAREGDDGRELAEFSAPPDDSVESSDDGQHVEHGINSDDSASSAAEGQIDHTSSRRRLQNPADVETAGAVRSRRTRQAAAEGPSRRKRRFLPSPPGRREILPADELLRDRRGRAATGDVYSFAPPEDFDMDHEDGGGHYHSHRSDVGARNAHGAAKEGSFKLGPLASAALSEMRADLARERAIRSEMEAEASSAAAEDSAVRRALIFGHVMVALENRVLSAAMTAGIVVIVGAGRRGSDLETGRADSALLGSELAGGNARGGDDNEDEVLGTRGSSLGSLSEVIRQAKADPTGPVGLFWRKWKADSGWGPGHDALWGAWESFRSSALTRSAVEDELLGTDFAVPGASSALPSVLTAVFDVNPEGIQFLLRTKSSSSRRSFTAITSDGSSNKPNSPTSLVQSPGDRDDNDVDDMESLGSLSADGRDDE